MCWGGNGWMWNGGYGGGGGWSWIATNVVLTVFFAVVITAIMLAVRYLTHAGHHGDPRGSAPSPKDVLAQRFAGGEIDDAEYGQRMTALSDHR